MRQVTAGNKIESEDGLCFSMEPFTLQPGPGPRSAWLGRGAGCYIYICYLDQT